MATQPVAQPTLDQLRAQLVAKETEVNTAVGITAKLKVAQEGARIQAMIEELLANAEAGERDHCQKYLVAQVTKVHLDPKVPFILSAQARRGEDGKFMVERCAVTLPNLPDIIHELLAMAKVEAIGSAKVVQIEASLPGGEVKVLVGRTASGAKPAKGNGTGRGTNQTTGQKGWRGPDGATVSLGAAFDAVATEAQKAEYVGLENKGYASLGSKQYSFKEGVVKATNLYTKL